MSRSLTSLRRSSGISCGCYPRAYVFFLLLSTFDLLLTNSVLSLGGVEVNYLARQVFLGWGMEGLVIYKVILVSIVVASCEVIGRAREGTGRLLSYLAVGLTSVPVILGYSQLMRFL